MCDILYESCPVIRADQWVAIVHTSDGKRHLVPTDAVTQHDAILAATQFRAAGIVVDQDTEPKAYGPHLISEAIVMRRARDIPELVPVEVDRGPAEILYEMPRRIEEQRRIPAPEKEVA